MYLIHIFPSLEYSSFYIPVIEIGFIMIAKLNSFFLIS